jgi:DNA-binding response OmpR family regulator
MAPPKCRILCVDDSEDTCFLLTALLSAHEVQTASNIEEAIVLAGSENFDLYILDYWVGGLEFCSKVREFDSLTPIIFFTGEAHASEKEKAQAAGASAYLIKPNDLEQLPAMVDRLVQIKCQAA